MDSSESSAVRLSRDLPPVYCAFILIKKNILAMPLGV